MGSTSRHLILSFLFSVFFISVLTPVAALADDKPNDPPQKTQPLTIIPNGLTLSVSARSAIDDPLTLPDEKERLRVFHGQLQETSNATQASAAYALARFDLTSPALTDADAPPLPAAEAAYLRGNAHLVADLLKNEHSPPAVLLKGQALAAMGRYEQATHTLLPLRDRARLNGYDNAPDSTAAATAIALLANLQGRPASEFKTVNDMLSEAQQTFDRLYWPALAEQGRIFFEKDSTTEAVKALHLALRLNPKASQAWYLLGQIALKAYNFNAAQDAVMRLRQINRHHVLADALETELYLTQKDPHTARGPLLEGLFRHPNHRRLLAAAAAVAALRFDDKMTAASIKQYDAVAPGDPLAHYLAGRYLSAQRQYDRGEQMLQTAIRLQPNWPQPHIELGLLLSQAGREEESLATLTNAKALDPYNKRAANTHKLMEALTEYQIVETDHFVIKFRDDIDRVLANDMPETLEQIYRDLTSTYNHKLPRKTYIEIMPNKRWFAVRITGMPWIWTIGACTGPVISLSPPRDGPDHAGPYDWKRVLRHEVVHTVTLSATDNRIPHWFTEACAVSQEPGPRDFDTCRLLAEALDTDELFDLDSINWAFVRPRKPTDRALAYAQSHWMYEYITETFGHKTILKILDLCKQGVPQNRVVQRATGQGERKFLKGFHEWARLQVRGWGLAPTPPDATIIESLEKVPEDQIPNKLTELIQTYPDHPLLLRLFAESAMEQGDADYAYTIVKRYASQRPVDPWADDALATLAIQLKQPLNAVGHLEHLDRLDQLSGTHAIQLTSIYRDHGQLDHAQDAATRAIARRPYEPKLREAAATLALQRKDADLALHHLEALTHIEPTQSLHRLRLAALLHRLGRLDEAHRAAKKALELNPNANAQPFLKKQ
ncbi:MAG: peptidase MA family metallohydrolase [Planctomycetota bacterium]|jgi:tetratricopeptide (TPR) repeat protein